MLVLITLFRSKTKILREFYRLFQFHLSFVAGELIYSKFMIEFIDCFLMLYVLCTNVAAFPIPFSVAAAAADQTMMINAVVILN